MDNDPTSETAANRAPVVSPNFTFYGDEDTEILGNLDAVDPDGDTITYSIKFQPFEGVASVDQDGVLTFSPEQNQELSSPFIVVVDDGRGETVETVVQVILNPINDAPIAIGGEVTGDEDIPIRGTLYGSDPDRGDQLNYSIISDPMHGSISRDGSRFTYTPDPEFSGTDSFEYRLRDNAGERSNIATMVLNVQDVNDAPTISSIEIEGLDDTNSITINEDETISGRVIAFDAEGDPFTLTARTSYFYDEIEIDPDGRFVYTPPENFNGYDGIDFTVEGDDYQIYDDSITININPVNDAPVAQDDILVVYGNGQIGGTLFGDDPDLADRISSDRPEDREELSFSLSSNASNGDVIVEASGSFTYTPDQNFVGEDHFTYAVTDRDGLVDTGTITLNVFRIWDTTNSDDTIVGTASPDIIFGLAGNDDLRGNAGDDGLAGGLGNDLLRGDLGNDVLFGNGGTDELIGGAGSDLLIGGAGSDVLNGGSGLDIASYLNASDAVTANLAMASLNTGQAAGDTFTSIEGLFGSRFDDKLTGNRAGNLIEGLNGNDILSGRNGNDTLFGGNGADVIRGGAGNDATNGGGGDDAIFGESGSDNLRGGGGDDAIAGGGGDDLIRGDAGGDMLNGGAGADGIKGGAGNDTANGGAGTDTIYGESGNDDLRGGGGNDVINGGGGVDLLRGDAGDDTLIGGSGNDELIGGRGSDTFVFESNNGTDTVHFEDDVDKIELRGTGLSFEDLNIDYGGGTSAQSIDYGSGTILIEGGNVTVNLTADDFIFS